MRDLLFLALQLPMIYFALRRHYIALALWVWTGFFVPVHWLHNLGESVSYNSLYAGLTLLSLLFSSPKPKQFFSFTFVIIACFWLLTTITSYLGISNQVLMWTSWSNFTKVMIITVCTAAIVRERREFNLIIWMIALSVGFYGFVEGLKFLASLGGHRIKGPTGHLIEDNNHLAAALCMTLPLMVYLMGETKTKLIKLGLMGVCAICVLAILGTHSRGGLIGLIVVGGYFWLKSNQKILSLIAIILVGSVAIQLLPERWFNRMDTIETAAVDDKSFAGRLNAWKIHTLIALDRPLTGGGFKAAEVSEIWISKSADLDRVDFFETPPPGERGKAAHSIYFQVLGDHGFIGFGMFMTVIGITVLKLSVIQRRGRRSPEVKWMSSLSKMLLLSIIAYCTTGAALSLAYFEFFWILVALTAALYFVNSEWADAHLKRTRNGDQVWQSGQQTQGAYRDAGRTSSPEESSYA
uniref:putative O-glycosylation ligase, exosortase A system-associated n=1 Tax=Thaumasiovibrio occultus TaxID=1891184 RepID=UPI000B362F82|nr:putative O-glycosylation ligase, exosortase A system-associated [Thaumasiovibrio occultus]